MMALGQGERMNAGLDDVDIAALRQLDDTSYLAVGHLDCTACDRLARLGLVRREPDDYWKITPAGRRLIQASQRKRVSG